MVRLRNRRKPVAEMNVVPYIDVMLVLLIIFMVTAPMINQGVKVDLPKVSSDIIPQNNDSKILTISVKSDKTYYWNVGSEVDVEKNNDTEVAQDLTQLIANVSKIIELNSEQGNNVQIFVRGDKSVDYGSIMMLMGNLQTINVENVTLITEAP